MSNYKEIAEQSFDKVEKLFAETGEPWIELSNDDGIKLDQRPPPPKPIGVYRVETTIDGISVEDLFQILWDPKYTKDLSTTIDKVETIEEGENFQVVYHAHKSPNIMVTARDFVVLRTWRKNDDGSMVISAKSVEDDRKKAVKGYVRGNLIYSAYRVEKQGDTVSLRYLIASDPSGSIPAFVLKLANKSLPQSFKQTKELVKKLNAQK
mmetsp:Transcript_2019/g.2900  ORF Transcript_2019/g.2900 Transcript_2019/m.2900 type:complete len:208 (-) Transcript_2019:2924-3547(-)